MLLILVPFSNLNARLSAGIVFSFSSYVFLIGSYIWSIGNGCTSPDCNAVETNFDLPIAFISSSFRLCANCACTPLPDCILIVSTPEIFSKNPDISSTASLSEFNSLTCISLDLRALALCSAFLGGNNIIY